MRLFHRLTWALRLTDAGLKAEFHHAYAVLIVEVDAEGDWFVRQINADTNGCIHDLDLRADGGVVEVGHRIKVLTPGDIQGTEIDPVARRVVWGCDGMVDELQPEVLVLHDVLNFGSRSHHNTVFDVIAAHYNRAESGEDEIEGTAKVLAEMPRLNMTTYMVKARRHHSHQFCAPARFWRNVHFPE